MNHLNQMELELEILKTEPTAPRISVQDIDDNIVHTEIVKHVSHGGKVLRWAVITTKNGYAVTGDPSVAVCRENDRAEIGEKIAIENAKNQMWSLMGYALAQSLYENAQ